ncbi:hypothetical protein LY76DRAFT_57855 [Colletotrichum caudatum]|nr:hypothetical protein LY76DRAFT_57855 [Colletotrichum caudatum]
MCVCVWTKAGGGGGLILAAPGFSATLAGPRRPTGMDETGGCEQLRAHTHTTHARPGTVFGLEASSVSAPVLAADAVA